MDIKELNGYVDACKVVKETEKEIKHSRSDIEKKILEDRKKKAEEEKIRIQTWINRLPFRMQRIVRMRYIEAKRWEEIADHVEIMKPYRTDEIKATFLIRYFGKVGLEIDSYCFCCEYDLRDDCSRCPIEWTGGHCLDGEYAEFKTEITENHNYSKASEIARKIANLPERWDV